jgi:hypothetical protein
MQKSSLQRSAVRAAIFAVLVLGQLLLSKPASVRADSCPQLCQINYNFCANNCSMEPIPEQTFCVASCREEYLACLEQCP